jgi:penicillin amidase
MAWVGLNPEYDNSFEVGMKGTKAKTVYEMVEITTGLKQPQTQTKQEEIAISHGFTQNMVFADVYGNIGYAISGTLIKRKNRFAGHRISQGWTGDDELLGFVAPEERPYLINPKKGYIVAANAQVSTTNSKDHPMAIPGTTGRSTRIDQMLASLIKNKSGKIDHTDMVEILKDNKDIIVDKIKGFLCKTTLEYINQKSPKKTPFDANLTSIIEMISKWDSKYDKNLIEPTYFTYWEKNIIGSLAHQTFPLDIETKNIYYHGKIFFKLF